MKLSELNESSVNYRKNYKNGVVVYLDKDNKKIRLNSSGEEERGMTQTIKNENDLKKVLRVYKKTDDYTVSLIKTFLKGSVDEYIDVQNKAKKKDNSREFRKALASMQMDMIKASKRK